MEDRTVDKNNSYVCLDCGNKYMEEQGLPVSGVCTCHKGICCCCGEEKTVTHERQYGWLAKWKSNE